MEAVSEAQPLEQHTDPRTEILHHYAIRTTRGVTANTNFPTSQPLCSNRLVHCEKGENPQFKRLKAVKDRFGVMQDVTMKKSENTEQNRIKRQSAISQLATQGRESTA
jgi:hypothetical protein